MTDLYPEHEKLTRHVRLSDATQQIGEWLDERERAICELVCALCDDPLEDHHAKLHDPAPEWRQVARPIEQLLADAFGIDLEALEREKRSMLDQLRQDQAGQPGIVEVVPPNPPHTFGPATTCPVDGCPVVVCGDPACDCGDHTHDQPETEESPL